MAQSRTLRAGWLVVALFPLACAVALEPELKDDGAAPRAGASGAGSTSVGSTSATGGTSVSAGTSSGGASAGKPSTGGSGTAGSGAAGKGGTSAGGGGAGGTGGTSAAGAANGGESSTGCSGLKTWKGGDSTLAIMQGEVIQWMGKRYKATTTIAYPNQECAPDKPVDWCASWFEPDGDC